jgi:hypothetical protein
VLTSGLYFFVGRPVVTGRSDVDGTVKFDVSFGRTVKFAVLELPSPTT